VIRQAFLDAKWYRDANAAYARRPNAAERPPVDNALAALQPAIAGRQGVLFVADEFLQVLRSAAIAKEAGVAARIVGAGDEYKRCRDRRGHVGVVPVNSRSRPRMRCRHGGLDRGVRHWQEAPGGARWQGRRLRPDGQRPQGREEFMPTWGRRSTRPQAGHAPRP
jgi:hypothetical protein